MPTLEAEQLCALPREGKVAKQLRQVKQKNKKKLLKFLSFQKMQMFAQDWPGSMALSSSSVKGPVPTEETESNCHTAHVSQSPVPAGGAGTRGFKRFATSPAWPR